MAGDSWDGIHQPEGSTAQQDSGTLVQEIKDGHGRWQPNPPTRLSHEVTVTAGAYLADALGQAMAQVNSYHHQRLQDQGAGLRVTTVCGDVIDAAEATDADIAAFRRPPELIAVTNPSNVHCSGPS